MKVRCFINRSKILQLVDAKQKEPESQCVSLHLEYKLVYTKRVRDGQHIVTAGWGGAHYRRNVQQYLLIMIHRYRTQFIKWRKNLGRSKILSWERGTLRFSVLLCCINELEYLRTFNRDCMLVMLVEGCGAIRILRQLLNLNDL